MYNNNSKFQELYSTDLNDNGITYDLAISIAQLNDNVKELISQANDLRNSFKKNTVFTCGIINAKSGFCSQDCAFCAQSIHYETGAETYPLIEEQQITQKAIQLADSGASRFSIVTSGFMLNQQEIDIICKAVTKIKERTDLILCTSIGTLTPSMAIQLKQSGVTYCHHNLETARSFFHHICSTHDYNDDINTITIAREAGLKICSGGIMGLGENWQQRVELAFSLKKLNVDSIPINFLNPIPGTALEKQPILSPFEALKCISLFRLIHPKKDIVICGGRETTLKTEQHRLFLAGANGLMIGNYLTTLGRNIETDIEMIKTSGLTII
jgi:biotin synthase